MNNMISVGYRPLTSEEVTTIRNNNSIPDTVSAIKTDNGQVVFADLSKVEELNPGFSSLSVAAQSVELRRGVPGVVLVLPLVPIWADPATGTTSSEIVSNINALSTNLQSIPLSNIIQVSKLTINKEYFKDSMVSLGTDEITFKNISTNTTVNVSLSELAGIQYSLATFTLLPLTTQTISVHYNMAEINKLSAGVTTIKSLVTLTGVTSIDRTPPEVWITPIEPDPLLIGPPPSTPSTPWITPIQFDPTLIGPPPSTPSPTPFTPIQFDPSFIGPPPEALVNSQSNWVIPSQFDPTMIGPPPFDPLIPVDIIDINSIRSIE